jgi:DNA-binding transcriptional MerR regulator
VDQISEERTHSQAGEVAGREWPAAARRFLCTRVDEESAETYNPVCRGCHYDTEAGSCRKRHPQDQELARPGYQRGRTVDKQSEEKELLEPVEPARLLQQLRLTTGKAAQFCGVSRRQLCYWTDTGIVFSVESEEEETSDDASRRSYDFEALYRVLLIQQALKHTPGLRRAAREVEQHLAARRRRGEELATSIDQKREDFLTEQADLLDGLAAKIREQLSRTQTRDRVLQLHNGLEWLSRLADRVLAGEVLLEEDAQACLRLASLIEQAEAKLESLDSSG